MGSVPVLEAEVPECEQAVFMDFWSENPSPCLSPGFWRLPTFSAYRCMVPILSSLRVSVFSPFLSLIGQLSLALGHTLIFEDLI